MNTQNRSLAHLVRTGMFLTLFGGVLWGVGGTCAQYLFQTKNIAPEWLVAVRLFIGGGILVIYNLTTQRRTTLSLFSSRRDCFDLVVYGVVGIALCQLSYFKAIAYSNAGTACVIQYFSPVLIILWVALVKKILPTRLEIIAVICALAGVWFVSTAGDVRSLSLSPEALFWGFMSAVAVSVYTVQPERILKKFDPQILLGWGMIAGAIALSPFITWWDKTPEIDVIVIALVAFIIVCGTILSFTFFMEGVRRIGPTQAGLYACVEPVVATILSALVLSTNFQLGELLGFVLVLLVPFILNASAYTSFFTTKRLSE